MRKFLILFCIVCSLHVLSQRRFRIITFGLPAFDEATMKEHLRQRNKVGKEFHVKYIRKNTCIGKPRWKKHNDRVVHKLTRINGEGWEKKLDKKVQDNIEAEKNLYH